MIVGQDVSILRHDESGPGAFLELRLLHGRKVPEETLEPRRYLHPRLVAGSLTLTARLDVHDAGLDVFRNRGERLAQALQGAGSGRNNVGGNCAGTWLLGRRLVGQMEEARSKETEGKSQSDAAGP